MALTSRGDRLGKMLGVLAANFRIDLTDMQREAYELGLSDVVMDALAKAGMRALRECKFMPTVAELRELAGKGKGTDKQPHYFAPADSELERIETCQYHVKHGPAVVAPDYVVWCRKCKRKKLEAAPRGETRALGEMLETAGYAPQNGVRR